MARNAYIAFMRNYILHTNPAFQEENLEPKEVCQQFGLKIPVRYT